MSIKQTKNVCDRDCFNCRFDDCVNDVIEIDEYIDPETEAYLEGEDYEGDVDVDGWDSSLDESSMKIKARIMCNFFFKLNRGLIN